MLNNNFKLLEGRDRLELKQKDRKRDLKAKDFFVNMKPTELLVKQPGPSRQSKNLWKELCKSKWNWLEREH